jgi:4-hydroxy-tetrahydrodipicolinate synthase
MRCVTVSLLLCGLALGSYAQMAPATRSTYQVANPVSAERKAELLADVKSKVKGVALPLLTFYQEDGTVDHAGMTAYVKQMISDGLVEGTGVILAVASGGDFPSLSIAERKAAAKTIIEAAEGKVPIFLSVQESHLVDTLDLAKYAESIGYYGIQVSVPYYWTTSDGDAIAWFEAVHNATERVILSFYNTPWESYDAPVAVLKEVAKLERVRVLKWYTDRAPMTFRWAQTITELKDDFAIIDNTLQPVFNHMMGGTAFISHLASVWPQNQLEMQAKLERGDYMGALEMQKAALTPWYDFRIVAGSWTSGEAPPVKAALVMSGRVNTTGPERAPSRALSPQLSSQLRALLVKIGVPGVKPEGQVHEL